MFYLVQNQSDKDAIELTTVHNGAFTVWASVHTDFLEEAKAEEVEVGDGCIIINQDQWAEYLSLREHAQELEYLRRWP